MSVAVKLPISDRYCFNPRQDMWGEPTRTGIPHEYIDYFSFAFIAYHCYHNSDYNIDKDN
jgi:hypothetical protein